MDGYNWSILQGHRWQSFSQVFKPTYDDMLGIFTGKPLMVAETASAEIGGNKAAWISDAKETDWRVESSQAAQEIAQLPNGRHLYNSCIHIND